MTRAAKEKNLTKNLLALIVIVYGILMLIKSPATLMKGSIEDGVFAMMYGIEGIIMIVVGILLKYCVVFKK